MPAALNHRRTSIPAAQRPKPAAAFAAGAGLGQLAHWRRRLQRSAAGLLLILGGAGCGAEPAFKLADGGAAPLAEWRGRWLLINYWAEWCAPCRDEIPELNALHHARPELAVLGVNYDGAQGDELKALIDRMGIEFPVLAEDPQPHWGYEMPSGLPMTVLIAPDGALHGRLLGPQTRETLLAAMLQQAAP